MKKYVLCVQNTKNLITLVSGGNSKYSNTRNCFVSKSIFSKKKFFFSKTCTNGKISHNEPSSTSVTTYVQLLCQRELTILTRKQHCRL